MERARLWTISRVIGAQFIRREIYFYRKTRVMSDSIALLLCVYSRFTNGGNSARLPHLSPPIRHSNESDPLNGLARYSIHTVVASRAQRCTHLRTETSTACADVNRHCIAMPNAQRQWPFELGSRIQPARRTSLFKTL